MAERLGKYITNVEFFILQYRLNFLQEVGVAFHNPFNDFISMTTYLNKKYIFPCGNVFLRNFEKLNKARSTRLNIFLQFFLIN